MSEMIREPLPQDRTVKHQVRSEPSVALPKGGKYRDSLPFPFARNATVTYPDTGESGDAYDVEAFLDA